MPIEPEIAPVIDPKRPVRATPKEGSSVVMWHPRIVGDSLIGDVGSPPLRTAFAIRDLRRLQVLGYSKLRTAGAVLAGIGVGLLWLFVDGVIGAEGG